MSVFHCMTQSLSQGGPGHGTCMGADRFKDLVNEAGFKRFNLIDIKSQTTQFYLIGH